MKQQPPIIKKNGRPEEYTQEIADRLCAQLAMGKSLRRALESSEDMPSMPTVFNWLRSHEEFLNQYTRAKEESADFMADEILDISDDARNDWMEDDYQKGKTPGYQLNGENIQRSKLRVDTRRWLMAKMKPKRYGDKLDLTTKGDKLPTPILGGITNGVQKEESETPESSV